MFKLSQDNDNDSTSSDLGAVVLEKEPTDKLSAASNGASVKVVKVAYRN